MVALSVALVCSIPTVFSMGIGAAVVTGSAPPGLCASTPAGPATTSISTFSSYPGNPKAVGTVERPLVELVVFYLQRTQK